MMSEKATATQLTTQVPIGGIIVPDTLLSSSTAARTSGSSTDKGGAIFQVPTSTNTLPSPTPQTTESTSTSSAAPTAAHNQTTTSSNLGPIIGGVVGGLSILILALVVFCCWKKRKEKRELNLHTMPYSVAVPFSVSRKTRPETMSTSSSDVPGFIHEKRVTADTMVERNDSTRVCEEEQQGPVELSTHNSRSFLPDMGSGAGTGHSRTPNELPGPINLAPPPSTHAELPSQDSRTPQQPEMPRNINVSPIDPPTASVRTSIVSPLTASASVASLNPPNPPHTMTSICSEGDPTIKLPGETYPGKRAYSTRREMEGGGGGGTQERVKGPNTEPIWPVQPRDAVLPKMRQGI